MIIPPTLPQSATPPPLSSQQQAMLTSFMHDGMTRDHLQRAVDRFKNLASNIKSAEEKFKRFKELCTASGTGEGYHLPNSLRTNLVERVKLPTVESDPAFFADTLTALRDAERTYNDKVFKTLREAKSKHIAFLKLSAQPDKITASAVLLFTPYMNAIADSLDEQRGVQPAQPAQASNIRSDMSFPRQHAHNAFLHELTQQLAQASMHIAAEAQRAAEAAALRREAERAAQEAVLRGAHSGATINAIAEQAAERVVHRALSHHRETSPSDSAHSYSSASRSQGAATATSPRMLARHDHDISPAAASHPSALEFGAGHGVARWPRLSVHRLHPAFFGRTDSAAAQPVAVQLSQQKRRRRAHTDEDDAKHELTSRIKRRYVADSPAASSSSASSRGEPHTAATALAASQEEQHTTASNTAAHAHSVDPQAASIRSSVTVASPAGADANSTGLDL
jgi:hypothetical protein